MSIPPQLAASESLFAAGNLNAAAESCRQLLLAAPDYLPGIVLLAKVARKANNLAAAEQLLTSCLQNAPTENVGELWFQLGIVLRAGSRMSEAAQAFRQATIATPEYAMAWSNLAAVCSELEQPQEAERCARRAVALAPQAPQPLLNLSEAIQHRGDVDAMIRCLEEALRIDPVYAQAHWNLSALLLLRGDYARGWNHFEWRELSGQIAIDHYRQSRWNGEPLTGKSLLIHAEQGLGDEIMLSSCYDDAIRRAGHCLLVCDPRLEKIFRRSFPKATVLGYQRRKDRAPLEINGQVDLQIPAGSVPRYFRQQASHFPQREHYLQADRLQIAQWRRQLSALGQGLKVGLSWRAGGQPSEHRRRTTTLAQWMPLFAVPGVQWVNLQYGYTGEDRAWAQSELGLTLHHYADADPLIDFDAYAAQMAALDLVISVDNTTVHLAGALGVPAWTLIPKVPSWRWGESGERSAWYSSVRLFRQSVAGQWESVMQRVAGELQRLVANPRSSAPSGKAHFAHRTQTLRRPRMPAPSPPMSTEITNLHVAIGQAHEHLDAGRLEKAEELCRLVLCMSPRQIRALRLLAQIAGRTGRLDLAIDALGRALVVQRRPDVCIELADALAKSGRREEARTRLEEALAMDPDSTAAQQALALLQQPAAPASVSSRGPHFSGRPRTSDASR